MAASAPMLLLLLAGFSCLAGVEQASADSCMQRWIRLAGASSAKAAQDEKLMALLKIDDSNHETAPVRGLLPSVLSGGAKLADRLHKCMRKSLAVCKERPPCTNRGACLLGKKSQRYACKCPKGLTGHYCEKDVDECRLSKTSCHGKAQCINTHGSYKCRCKAGYQGNGKVCTNINECASSPCQNGGKCSNLENRFSCSCPGGFSGQTCKEDFNECTSNPCQHGGQCIDQRNRFVCVCPVRYDGERCQHLWLQRNFFTSMEKRLQRRLNAQGRKQDQFRKSVEGKLNAQGRKQDAEARRLDQFRKSVEGKLNAQGRDSGAEARTQGQFRKLMEGGLKAQGSKQDQFRKSMEGKLKSETRRLDEFRKSVEGKLNAQGRNEGAEAKRQDQFRKAMVANHVANHGCKQIDAFCERVIDGGGWSLVWKHSYLQVSRSDLPKAKTYSSFGKACTDLSDGWCNVPNKQLKGAKEQMIVAYHKGAPVFAYKSPLNPNLGTTEQGARLRSGWSRVLDKCTLNNGVRPDIYSGGPSIIDGLAFDKSSPTNVNSNCDTVYGNYLDCRWPNCVLPKSISAKTHFTQMTLAIFVR